MVECLILIALIMLLLIIGIFVRELEKETINVSDIKIRQAFKNSKINLDKMCAKEEFFIENGYFLDKIILNQNNLLLDGYYSYLIAKKYNIRKVDIVRNKN